MGYGMAPGNTLMGGAAALSGGAPGAPGMGGSVAKSSRVCRHYVRGRCTWGPQCRFTHDPAALAMEASKPDMFGAKPPGAPMGRPMSGGSGSGQDRTGSWLGMQQSQLQNQRHTILLAALQAKFMIRALPNAGAPPDGSQKGQVILTSLPSAPEIIITVLNDGAIGSALERLEADERVREGGLLYLVGESSVFWSMMRLWHVKGSTSSQRWDEALERANTQGTVECMFFRTSAGCLSQRCAFEHVGIPGNQPPQQQQQQPPQQQQQQQPNPNAQRYHPSLAHMQAQQQGGDMSGLLHSQGLLAQQGSPDSPDAASRLNVLLEDDSQQDQQNSAKKSPGQHPSGNTGDMDAIRGIW